MQYRIASLMYSEIDVKMFSCLKDSGQLSRYCRPARHLIALFCWFKGFPRLVENVPLKIAMPS